MVAAREPPAGRMLAALALRIAPAVAAPALQP
jgi:hypothetical protein